MKIIFLFSLLFLLPNCQSGGGSGGGDGGGGFDDTGDSGGSKDCSATCYGALFGSLGGAFVLFMIVLIIKKCRKNISEEESKESEFQTFIQQNNTSNEAKLQEIKSTITKNNWKMGYFQENKLHNVKILSLEIQFVQNREMQYNQYLKIKMQCSDINGNSILNGAIKQTKRSHRQSSSLVSG